jgi:hypothetical protein
MRPSQPRLVVLCLSVAFLVALAVHATSAPVDLSPNSLNFGSQVVGSTSGVSTVNVTNHLSNTLTLFSITTLGDFTQTNNCGNSVATGHSCTIKVTFSPTAIGTRSGQLIVSDSDSTSPQSVQLSELARLPAYCLSRLRQSISLSRSVVSSNSPRRATSRTGRART